MAKITRGHLYVVNVDSSSNSRGCGILRSTTVVVVVVVVVVVGRS